MTEWDGPDLQQLAPVVEHQAASELFGRRRRRRRCRRRALSGGCAVAVVVLGLVAGRSALTEESTSLRTTSPSAVDSGRGFFNALHRRPTPDEEPGLRAAVTENELIELWRDLEFADEPPVVDFDERIVVSITLANDACPPDLLGFIATGQGERRVDPLFEEPKGRCRPSPRSNWNYLVALERRRLDPGFVLVLPEALTASGEQRLRVDVPVLDSATTAAPTPRVPQERLLPGPVGDVPEHSVIDGVAGGRRWSLQTSGQGSELCFRLVFDGGAGGSGGACGKVRNYSPMASVGVKDGGISYVVGVSGPRVVTVELVTADGVRIPTDLRPDPSISGLSAFVFVGQSLEGNRLVALDTAGQVVAQDDGQR